MSDSSDDDNHLFDDGEAFDDSDMEEEILASDDGEDSEGDDDEDVFSSKYDRFKIESKKDEMASDLEDEEEDEEQLPSSMAWGKNKQSYYHTDYVDKDFRSMSSCWFVDIHLMFIFLQVKKRRRKIWQSTKKRKLWQSRKDCWNRLKMLILVLICS